jgi:hypothetical protein
MHHACEMDSNMAEQLEPDIRGYDSFDLGLRVPRGLG